MQKNNKTEEFLTSSVFNSDLPILQVSVRASPDAEVRAGRGDALMMQL